MTCWSTPHRGQASKLLWREGSVRDEVEVEPTIIPPHPPDLNFLRPRALASLCYCKTFWAKNLFPEIAIGEDTRFTWSSRAKNAVIVPDHTFYVGLVHSANTSRKVVTGPYWHFYPVEEVHRLLGADLAFYHLPHLG